MEKRSRYSAQLKQQALHRILTQGHSVPDVSRDVAIPTSTLYAWVAKEKQEGKCTQTPETVPAVSSGAALHETDSVESALPLRENGGFLVQVSLADIQRLFDELEKDVGLEMDAAYHHE